MARDPSTCGEGSGQRSANSSPLAWRPPAQGQEDPPPGSGRQHGRQSETVAGDPASTPPAAGGGRRSMFPRGPLGCQPAEGLGRHHKVARAQQPPGPRGGQAAGMVCSRAHSVGGHCLAPQTAGLPRGHLATTTQRQHHGRQRPGSPRETGTTLHKGGAQADPPRGPGKEPTPACTTNMASSFRTEVPANDD